MRCRIEETVVRAQATGGDSSLGRAFGQRLLTAVQLQFHKPHLTHLTLLTVTNRFSRGKVLSGSVCIIQLT